METKDITKCAFMAVTDPSLVTVDFEDLAKRHKERLQEQENNRPTPNQADFRKEYNQLRQRLFELQQNAKTFEQRTNDAAGKARLIEQSINETLKLKKAASDVGNLRGERTYEQAVARLETELLDAQEEFNKNKRWSGQAARALREFNQQQQGRIAELKELLDGKGLPDVKSDNVPK